jgi:branched-chain amino acid aminotransferase
MIPILKNSEWAEKLSEQRKSVSGQLYAFYSSVTGGITTDPALMNVPIDDHVVHRGDGIFESLRCSDGHLYNALAHLMRLEKSCEGIRIKSLWTPEEILHMITATIRASEQKDCLIRVIISRGTGTMGIDPKGCDGPQLYILVYRLTARGEKGFPAPVRAGISQTPIKPREFATIKTCNYLPNVIMKIEAAERGLDFVISVDEQGHLGEGATENVAIVTRNRELLMPTPERVLAGTTAKCALDLGKQLVESGVLTAAEYRNLTVQDAQSAAEMFLLGTTADCTPIVEFEGHRIGDGTPGPIAKQLFDLLSGDMTPISDKLTPVFTSSN